SIAALVSVVKSFNEVRCDGHCQFVRLAPVTQIGEIRSMDFIPLESFGLQVRHCKFMQFRKSGFQFGAGPVGADQERSRIILTNIREQQTERGQSARKLRYDDAPHPQRLREVSRMQSTRTAKTKA